MTVPFGYDSELNDWILATGDPTGFSDPTNVIVTYDSTARTITLTGTVKAYYKGRIVPELVSGWVSAAHSSTTGVQYFLYYNGSAFVWGTSAWTFPMLQIAFVNYGAVSKYALRECHGLMPWSAHEEFHQNIGTYRTSGGVVGDYTLASNTAAQRRPTVTAAVIHDEDCITTLAALATGSYTQVSLTGAAVTSFTTAAAEIVPVLTANPYYNSFTTPNWGQTLMANNSYMSVWLAAVPAAEDAGSQAYRFIWIQGQSNGTLASQNALTPGDLNLGSLTTIATEFVFIAKVIIRFTGGNWDLTSVTSLAGNKFFQTAAISTPFAWGGITGTLSNQADLQAALDLKANLTANTFTGVQTINMNTAAPPTPPANTVFHLVGADGSGRMSLEGFAAQPNITFRRANGTNASKTAILSGDSLGTLAWFGHDGTNYSGSGRATIHAYADANFTSTAQPTFLVFNTTPSASMTITERMRISSAGSLLVGTNVDGLTANGSLAIAQDLAHRGTNLGVFNTTPTTKQTVTGSRGGNAALASLLTALAAYGLITNSSTA